MKKLGRHVRQKAISNRRIFADVIVDIFLLSYDLTWKHRRMYELNLKDLKELVNLSNLCNFRLFTSTIKGHRSNRKPPICCVAKTMSYAFFVEF